MYSFDLEQILMTNRSFKRSKEEERGGEEFLIEDFCKHNGTSVANRVIRYGEVRAISAALQLEAICKTHTLWCIDPSPLLPQTD